ncbi:hypothetical protein OE766_14395 [Pararhizobium sp. YC-54]|uniref:hypothetical protein n=1 Tax=Pararhizobium sp. YC-54 TaxID=2986920 RepID=UPI0021F733C2|nr:hypothetical protein [Pararhizobium sp. YC-54]MCV9999433.1 hypothetical protein [Pararhizobium sp. YC-54]
MHVDTSRFPMVFLYADRQEGSPAETQLEALLDRAERFVLVTEHDPAAAHDETPEERRQKTLFLKRNRDRLQHLCAGAIVIEDGKSTPMPVRLAAQAVGKAFGIAFHFVPGEAEAIAQALHLLGCARRARLN